MALYIDTSRVATDTVRILTMSYGFLDRITDRLVTTARTDPAVAVSLSGRANSDLAYVTQQLSTTQNDISMHQAAQIALDALAEHLADMRELAMQASSGGYAQDQISAMDARYQELAGEVYGIVANTRFNGTALFSGADSLVALSLTDVTEISLTSLTDIGLSDIAIAIADLTAAQSNVSADLGRLATTAAQLEEQADRLSAFEVSVYSVEKAMRAASTTAASIEALFTLALNAQANTLADSALRLLDLNLSDG
ncbi:hypothetical protein LCGC14_1464330 [marine sediment metagenome]|uniref:Flagellin N-terminal domain-containing protein n=1 Tax=marine sediment metagenome TaxID=412755 RepID=A0A0F9JE64_9ZZZZ